MGSDETTCWEFEVQVSSHDELKRGIIARDMWTGNGLDDTMMISIYADACDSDQDAWLAAWQMANLITGAMPTLIRMVSFPSAKR